MQLNPDAEHKMPVYLKQANGDYARIELWNQHAYKWEGRAAAIAGNPHSLSTVGFSISCLRSCKRVKESELPMEWLLQLVQYDSATDYHEWPERTKALDLEELIQKRGFARRARYSQEGTRLTTSLVSYPEGDFVVQYVSENETVYSSITRVIPAPADE